MDPFCKELCRLLLTPLHQHSRHRVFNSYKSAVFYHSFERAKPMEIMQWRGWALWVMAKHLPACRAQHVLHSVGHMRMGIVVQCKGTPCEHTRMLCSAGMRVWEWSPLALCVGADIRVLFGVDFASGSPVLTLWRFSHLLSMSPFHCTADCWLLVCHAHSPVITCKPAVFTSRAANGFHLNSPHISY
jgi:hypothetical protein